MLFDPQAVLAHPRLFIELLMITLVAKPLAALGIVWFLGYSPRAALTVAIALAQIGEFSFIVADLALHHGLVNSDIRSLLVACAIVSIALNPLIFRAIIPLEARLRRHPRLWRAINRRSEAETRRKAAGLRVAPHQPGDGESRAIIIGYGPVGRTAAGLLKDFGIKPVMIDLNVDTVSSLIASGETAIYGDAGQREILQAAGIDDARYLLITVPALETRTVVVIVARELNPNLKIFVRAHYLGERAWLEEIGVTEVCYEEAETAMGLAAMILREVGAGEDRIDAELERIRGSLALRPLLPAEQLPTGEKSTTPSASGSGE
jgi:CPA2 family monovalent cation:H+ antiporter-2